MPLFGISEKTLTLVRPRKFEKEKHLQTLIEQNLETVFGCRLIASEFVTGTQHAGRIDTLALSEDDNPTIIEYKKDVSSELINQSMYYLNWLDDHRGDFEIAAQEALGTDISVDWSTIRVICIAPGYNKLDLHAVQQIGAGIELWKYRLFENDCLLLEDIHVSAPRKTKGDTPTKSETANYTWEYHEKKGTETTRDIARYVRDVCKGLSDSVEEIHLKNYVAFRLAKNFCCLVIRKQKVYLYLHLRPGDYEPEPGFLRDMSNIGHYGTGDLQVTLQKEEDVERARRLIEDAFRAAGGA